MEDLDNIEGIGMDREFEDMEMDVQPTKRKRISQKPMTSSRKPTSLDKNDKILELAASGFNVNQIGSMLGVHTQYIKELLAKQ